ACEPELGQRASRSSTARPTTAFPSPAGDRITSTVNVPDPAAPDSGAGLMAMSITALEVRADGPFTGRSYLGVTLLVQPNSRLPTNPGCGILPVMEITLVKASGPGDRDRAWLNADDVGHRVAVHVVHDLPHLAVESEFGITDGLWAELAAGSHAESDRAASARDPKRHKQ